MNHAYTKPYLIWTIEFAVIFIDFLIKKNEFALRYNLAILFMLNFQAFLFLFLLLFLLFLEINVTRPTKISAFIIDFFLIIVIDYSMMINSILIIVNLSLVKQ